MATASVEPVSEVERLELTEYNATVLSLHRCHDDLMILRVRPDRGVPRFEPGQYTVLGLGSWERRIAGCQAEAAYDTPRIIKRAYSVSSTLLDTNGHLLPVVDSSYLEFYIALVRRSETRPPALTPRLFTLSEGDRLHIGMKFHGRYSLSGLTSDTNVVLASTGTGEAPHNAMLALMLSRGHLGRIAMVSCVRQQRDLGYLQQHRQLEQMYRNYRSHGAHNSRTSQHGSERSRLCWQAVSTGLFPQGRF